MECRYTAAFFCVGEGCKDHRLIGVRPSWFDLSFFGKTSLKPEEILLGHLVLCSCCCEQLRQSSDEDFKEELSPSYHKVLSNMEVYDCLHYPISAIEACTGQTVLFQTSRCLLGLDESQVFARYDVYSVKDLPYVFFPSRIKGSRFDFSTGELISVGLEDFFFHDESS